MEIMTSWERRGLEQGKKEGVFLVALRLLQLRIGSLPMPLEERLRSLSLEQLETLCEVSFGFSALADVENWLSTHS